MDLCHKCETDLENTENNEIQNTEETDLTYTCPDERSEKNHVCCLLNISDITLKQDERTNEFVIGTGWEEAVRGWGRTSPTACIWPRKKLKKARVGESASSCLLCVSLSQGSPEARPQTEPGKLEAEAGALAVVAPEKDRRSSSQPRGPPQGPKIASRESSKICLPSSHGEKKSLQIKEFIWCTEDWATPEKGKDPKSHEHLSGGGAGRGFSISDPLTSKALLVLPPLKASPPSGSDALGKSKNLFLQPEEKVLSVEKDECVACTFGWRTVGRKGEKRPTELAKHLKFNETPPFPAHVAPREWCCPYWSFLPERNLLCPPNPNSLCYLATLRLLQKQGVQDYKATFKPKEPRPPFSIQKRLFTEAERENRPQMLETKVFPRPLLPSLTVSSHYPPLHAQTPLSGTIELPGNQYCLKFIHPFSEHSSLPPPRPVIFSLFFTHLFQFLLPSRPLPSSPIPFHLLSSLSSFFPPFPSLPPSFLPSLSL